MAFWSFLGSSASHLSGSGTKGRGSVMTSIGLMTCTAGLIAVGAGYAYMEKGKDGIALMLVIAGIVFLAIGCLLAVWFAMWNPRLLHSEEHLEKSNTSR
jgi:cation transporter-like permease